jgi:hypothetical protein
MPPFSSLATTADVHVSPSIDVVIVLTYPLVELKS